MIKIAPQYPQAIRRLMHDLHTKRKYLNKGYITKGEFETFRKHVANIVNEHVARFPKLFPSCTKRYLEVQLSK